MVFLFTDGHVVQEGTQYKPGWFVQFTSITCRIPRTYQQYVD